MRGDIAVKIFGDEFEPMLRAANEVAASLRAVRGAVDVKVEQTGGLPVLEIKVDKAAIARRGLSVSAVHDVIGAAVGGQEAGVIFEGDRSFEIVVRLPESVRADLEALGNLPVALAEGDAEFAGAEPAAQPRGAVLLRRGTEPDQPRERQAPHRGHGQRARPRSRLGGRGSAGSASRDRASCRAGYWIAWGGQSENLAAARQRLAIVVPACFVMIFLLLLARWARRATRCSCSARCRWR